MQKNNKLLVNEASNKLSDYIASYIIDRCIELDSQIQCDIDVWLSGTHIIVAGDINSKKHKAADSEIKTMVKAALGKVYGMMGKKNPTMTFDIHLQWHKKLYSTEIWHKPGEYWGMASAFYKNDVITPDWVNKITKGDIFHGKSGGDTTKELYNGYCPIGTGYPWGKSGTKEDLLLRLVARFIAVEYIKRHPVNKIYCRIEPTTGTSELDIMLFDDDKNVVAHYFRNISAEELVNHFSLKEPLYCDMCFDGLFSMI